MIKVFYNPKTNILALGTFYKIVQSQMIPNAKEVRCYLIDREINKEFSLIDITRDWLLDWEYIGDYGVTLD